MVKGLTEVISSEKLLKKKKISALENRRMLKDQVVMRFDSYKNAFNFAINFYFKYLVPKYGEERAGEFPIMKITPLRNIREVLDELFGFKKRSPKHETWFAIPNSRLEEVEEYLTSKY